jgi:hypothetical protein
MPTLSKDLRNQLARVTLQARIAAEAACSAALENLAVHEKDYRGHMSVEQRQLRNRLRARGRALGDSLDERSGKQEIKRLSEDAAYEHWHRLLFTRFLAENKMLHDDDPVTPSPVTLEDCEELAPDMGAKHGFELACRYASRILPGVFRTNDPVFELTLALNDQVELRGLLDSLPGEVFTADDSLGWTYQFWQTQRKAEVNASGKKIGADEISPVTQLFTEDYMVEFLLHNTLGAWWAGKLGPIHAGSEDEARTKTALPPRNGLPGITWTYLRFIQDEKTKTWSPGAGTFDGWPKQAAEITLLDPCMGSGHFPVFALPILARLRMEEENLSAKDAVFAVLRDNIHGLELDPRCCQIGAFNLALSAWKLAKYQALPSLHIACCGLAPQAKKDDWLKIAGDNDKLRRGMARLYQLFEQAPILGSLINPRASGDGDLLEASFDDLAPLLEKALADEKADDASHEMAVTARGVAKAAEILAGQFTLVATNVPFLTQSKFSLQLKKYIYSHLDLGKENLASAFSLRMLSFLCEGGTVSFVSPQGWWFLKRYEDYRRWLLEKKLIKMLFRLGENAFEIQIGELIGLSIIENSKPDSNSEFLIADAASGRNPADKASLLRIENGTKVMFSNILDTADYSYRPTSSTGGKIADIASVLQGLVTGDSAQYFGKFWEHLCNNSTWEFIQSTSPHTICYGGLSDVILWEKENGRLAALAESVKGINHSAQNWRKGKPNWGKPGVVVSQMGNFPATIYLGDIYDHNCCAIVPNDAMNVAALWCFCSSSEFSRVIKALNQNRKIEVGTVLQADFDLAHWQKIAAKKYPDGLPKPHSDNPTQWLFNGHPKDSEQTLHVAVARLCGYRWPRQTGSSFPDCPALGPDGLESLADEDGIVCLPALNREQPAAVRLRALLAAALSTFDEKKLLAATGAKSSTLEDWLRDECFEQHAKLFHHRPFLWHIWDGRKDGFSVLVNYHKLDHATLQKLTYTYLGNWIYDQESDAKADKPGAAERLTAAQALQAELAKILEGEAPYDIFVRWKPLSKQAIGWHPDFNDGVRLNIRPFLTAQDMGKKGAGLLRTKPNIKWEKNKGYELQCPQSDYPWFWCESEPTTDPIGGKTFTGHRWNDVHLSLATKNAAK